MWLLIPEGFFSIVRKEGEKDLCIRARVREDLERLRERYLPTLSEPLETPGGDYRFRAWIGRAEFATGLAAIVGVLDYSNFKDEVAKVDPERAHLYGRVWSVLGELQQGGPFGF
jgi:hypothetical protein